MVVYGFHPFEPFSIEVGKRLERNPPANTDVMKFTPPSFDYRYVDLTEKEQNQINLLGYRDLRKFAVELYKDLPFIIDVHEYPSYADQVGDELEHILCLLYPILNSKVRKILQGFRANHRLQKEIEIMFQDMQSFPGYHSLGIELFPVRFRKGGHFDIMSLEDGENLVRDVISFIQKNYVI